MAQGGAAMNAAMNGSRRNDASAPSNSLPPMNGSSTVQNAFPGGNMMDTPSPPHRSLSEQEAIAEVQRKRNREASARYRKRKQQVCD